MLRQAGIAFTRLVSEVDEDALAAELMGLDPSEHALALARAKAEAVAAVLSSQSLPLVDGRDADDLQASGEALASRPTTDIGPPTARTSATIQLVLGCDSVFVIDGEVHGKPHTPAEATRRWRLQRGRTGTLMTGHWLIEVGSGRAVGSTVQSDVTFVDATNDEIADYVASGEPLGVAGGFTLEGRAGPLIARVEGDPSNVLGLSLPGLRDLLGTLGYTLREFFAGSA